MSDPVTNVEIEDVLSSIRRLVSDGDKARTRDATPAEVAITQVTETPKDAIQPSASSKDKFVLTPALMVVDEKPSEDSVLIEVEEGTDDGWFRSDDEQTSNILQEVEASEDTAQPYVLNNEAAAKDETQLDEDVAEFDNAPQSKKPETSSDEDGRPEVIEDQTLDTAEAEAPLELTNMVWEPIGNGRVDDIQDEPTAAESIQLEKTTPAQMVDTVLESAPAGIPDRSELVATIAELEAAVGRDAEDYEPDGSEVMGQTIAWPGAVARNLNDIEEADVNPAELHSPAAQDTAADATLDPVALERPVVTPDAQSTNADIFEDDDLDGLMEADGVALDEEALRALVSEVVREELTGPLGERITRNVRKLVRREIYRILSSQEFD